MCVRRATGQTRTTKRLARAAGGPCCDRGGVNVCQPVTENAYLSPLPIREIEFESQLAQGLVSPLDDRWDTHTARVKKLPRGRRAMNFQILLSAPDVGEVEQEFVLAALRSGWVAPAGPDLEAFEVAVGPAH